MQDDGRTVKRNGAAAVNKEEEIAARDYKLHYAALYDGPMDGSRSHAGCCVELRAYARGSYVRRTSLFFGLFLVNKSCRKGGERVL